MTAAEWITKRRELLAAASEGPWDYYRPHPNYRTYQVSSVAPGGYLDDEVANCDDVLATENAALIADARTSLPRALAALEAVLAEHERGHFGPILGFRCRRCITGSAGYAVPSPWPCSTVTAIETALGGES